MQSRARSSYAEPQPLLADDTCLHWQSYKILKEHLSTLMHSEAYGLTFM